MKKIGLLSLLSLLLLTANFNVKAQEVSSVIISGFTYISGSIEIETVRPDYSVDKIEFSRKEDKNFHAELKRELDKWIQKGFYIDQTNSNGESNLNYRYTYILIRIEE